ncbi:VF530 family protein [Verrucomicrobiota bacterium sgz303538]
MNDPQANNPLHGITLEMILTQLVDHYGWDELGRIIDIRCFNFDPSIKSSLKFLRKTPWARKKVEDLYLWLVKTKAGHKRGQ